MTTIQLIAESCLACGTETQPTHLNPCASVLLFPFHFLLYLMLVHVHAPLL